MFRKLIMSVVSSAALFGVLAATPAVVASETASARSTQSLFKVYFKSRSGSWSLDGSFRNRGTADNRARVLRSRGFAVRVETVSQGCGE
jgi:hypothetical protein